MAKNKTDQSCNPEPRAFGDRLLQQSACDAAAAVLVVNINAQLNGTAVRAPADERVDAEPARDLLFELRNPQRMAVRRVLVEPLAACFDR